MSDPIPQVPRDPRKARIGNARWQNPVRAACTRFRPVDMLNPDKNKTAEQIGYTIHAHCWILVNRVIGIGLVETNLKIFVKAVERFWMENLELWNLDPFDDESIPVPDRPVRAASSDEPSATWGNPAIVPEIQGIIEQATRILHTHCHSQRMWSSVVSQVPLEIAIQIADMAKLASITDMRNMLAAFEWRLPDSYWQSCCQMDLIFEYDDLRKTNNPVDWQFLGLATGELLEDPKWYNKSGLRTRRRTFQLLGQIKSVFLNLLEQENMEPGSLSEKPHRRYPLRKAFL